MFLWCLVSYRIYSILGSKARLLLNFNFMSVPIYTESAIFIERPSECMVFPAQVDDLVKRRLQVVNMERSCYVDLIEFDYYFC